MNKTVSIFQSIYSLIFRWLFDESFLFLKPPEFLTLFSFQLMTLLHFTEKIESVSLKYDTTPTHLHAAMHIQSVFSPVQEMNCLCSSLRPTAPWDSCSSSYLFQQCYPPTRVSIIHVSFSSGSSISIKTNHLLKKSFFLVPSVSALPPFVKLI